MLWAFSYNFSHHLGALGWLWWSRAIWQKPAGDSALSAAFTLQFCTSNGHCGNQEDAKNLSKDTWVQQPCSETQVKMAKIAQFASKCSPDIVAIPTQPTDKCHSRKQKNAWKLKAQHTTHHSWLMTSHQPPHDHPDVKYYIPFVNPIQLGPSPFNSST